MKEEPAYVKIDAADKNSFKNAMVVYNEALQHAQVSASDTRDFRGLTPYIDGRPGFNNKDFDWFRPGQAAPTKPKDIISFARFAYRRIGLIHNAIDLMGDFACQGIRLVHPNKSVQRFYNDWFKQVEGKRVSERIAHLLIREANVPIRFYTAKINKKKRQEMIRAFGSDMDAVVIKRRFAKNEIPWKYVFLDPLVLEPISESFANLSGNQSFKVKLPIKLKAELARLKTSSKKEEREIFKNLAPEIKQAVNGNGEYLLPTDKVRMLYYKKDDWQVWADPMLYSAFESLNLYQRLQLADKAALDGARNKVRVWKIGNLEYGLAPTKAASSTLASILGANTGNGTVDIVWGPDIELIETSDDLDGYLGEEKYKPTLMSIYASLGIPPTLTGTFGATGTTNNFISLKTLIERLNYVRSILVDFWNDQIKIVQQAMNFRLPATVEFDIMYLDDPAAMLRLITELADRNIVSNEFVQNYVKAVPEIEDKRIDSEEKKRSKNGRDKVSPYHQVDKEYMLKKTALQTGAATPDQVGVKLTEGDKLKKLRDKNETGPGSPGRPPGTPDSVPRKQRTFKPKQKAAMEMWAKDAQLVIAKVITPIILNYFNKKSVRELSKEEFNHLERIKFEILCNLDMKTELNERSIARAAQNPPADIHDEFGEWVEEARQHMDLTVGKIRDLQAAFYAYYKNKE